MKKSFLMIAVYALFGASCGNTGGNNNNEDNTAGEISPIDSMNPVGSPNTSDVPMRDSFATDTNNSTSGPDNATPKGSAMDSTRSIR